ncbi:hypothetical protein [Wolbachia endosymbiont (group A) of Ennomos erosarius]|uniref:hypothetical protein n=1 Tax=Wolbachia endosymbiont (group A) of Ennomos erosarius TaxID=3066174 RepID=UPI003341818A
MNYTLMPSLKHKALVEIAITLWNQDDAWDLASKFYFSSPILNVSERKREWQKVEDEVIKKVLKLPLPELLKKELSSFVEAIGWQILIWKQYHKNLLGGKDARASLSKLCWTPRGTIDKEKTAKILVQDENLDIAKRYRLACTYCLEDNILTLWKQISGRKLYGKDLRKIRINESPLVSFWSHHIEEETAQLGDIIRRYCQDDSVTHYEYAFRRSAVSGNEAATRYFLQKLTPEEKDKVLVRTAEYVAKRRCDCVSEFTDFSRENYIDVLCFLLSEMDREQQMEVFKSCSYEVLKCFLDWPWQSFFMETAQHMWAFLSEEGYDCLLRVIVNKMIDGNKDYNYQKLFGIFWQQGPSTHTKHVIDKCGSGGLLLLDLFKVEDVENIKLIFQDATPKEKERLIFCSRGQDICQDLIYGDRGGFIEFFIRECISSKNEMVKFREEFKERITWCCSREEFTKRKDKWDKFFQLLDNLIQENDKKRGIEGEESSPAKKLRSIELEEVTHSMKK